MTRPNVRVISAVAGCQASDVPGCDRRTPGDASPRQSGGSDSRAQRQDVQVRELAGERHLHVPTTRLLSGVPPDSQIDDGQQEDSITRMTSHPATTVESVVCLWCPGCYLVLV